MRRVTETRDFLRAQVRDFLQYFGGIPGRFQSVDHANFFQRESQRLGKYLCSLRGANVRAGNQHVRFRAQSAQAERGGPGLLHAPCCERPFRIGWRFRVGTIDGYPVANQIEDHGLRYLLFPLNASEFGAEMKFSLKQIRFARKSGEIEPRTFGGANLKDGPSSGDLYIDAGDLLRVL
jgi:hypothetical protein